MNLKDRTGERERENFHLRDGDERSDKSGVQCAMACL